MATKPVSWRKNPSVLFDRDSISQIFPFVIPENEILRDNAIVRTFLAAFFVSIVLAPWAIPWIVVSFVIYMAIFSPRVEEFQIVIPPEPIVEATEPLMEPTRGKNGLNALGNSRIMVDIAQSMNRGYANGPIYNTTSNQYAHDHMTRGAYRVAIDNSYTGRNEKKFPDKTYMDHMGYYPRGQL